MWVAVLLVLLAATVVTFGLVYGRQVRRIVRLDAARKKVEQEETRVFDFLHRLGVSLSETTRPGDLHARIVEGALRVLNAQTGALYLANDPSGTLRPAYMAKDCPAFFEVQEKARQESGKNFVLQHYLRLHAVKLGEGVLGAVWRDREPILLSGEDSRLDVARKDLPATKSAMLAPLSHAGKELGVLLVVRTGNAEPFQRGDFQTFKAIA